MASKTTKLESIRRRKKAKQGSKRKARERNQGTTKSMKELFGED
tara:strand:- start:5301 stop:5432 length:132 start_codon:yes stop_codon:yes gene_type:complete